MVLGKPSKGKGDQKIRGASEEEERPQELPLRNLQVGIVEAQTQCSRNAWSTLGGGGGGGLTSFSSCSTFLDKVSNRAAFSFFPSWTRNSRD